MGSPRLVLALASALFALTGCDLLSRAATSTSQSETFNFRYAVLQPDTNGIYTVLVDTGTGSCGRIVADEDDLADLLRTRTADITRDVGGGPITSEDVQFSLDGLTACYSGRVTYSTSELQEEELDAAGNVILDRPENFGADLVEAGLSSGGVLNVNVYESKIVGTTVSQTAAPGSVDVTTIEIPAARVGRSGTVFSHSHLTPQFKEVEIQDVLIGPPRFTAEFAFLAKQGSTDSDLLLVWDGEMVLRTDL